MSTPRSAGVRQQCATGDRLAPRVVFAHPGLATTGLLVWAGFLATRWAVLAWLAVGLLMLVIGLGISTVTLWTPFPAHRGEAGAASGRGTGGSTAALAAPAREVLASGPSDELLARALTDEVLLGKRGRRRARRPVPGQATARETSGSPGPRRTRRGRDRDVPARRAHRDRREMTSLGRLSERAPDDSNVPAMLP